MNFDPEDILKAVERMREAFNRAAEADSGSAQRLFQKLSSKIDNLFDQAMDPRNQDLEPKKMVMKMLPSVMELQMTMSQIKREAQSNAQAAEVLDQLSREIQDEAKVLLPMLGNLPGIIGGLPGGFKLPGMDFGQPKEPPQTPPAPPSPPKKSPRPPRKPGSDGFKF